MAGDTVITVDATPNGLGDAVTMDPATGEALFVKPEQRRMTLGAFLDHMEADVAEGAAARAGAGADVLYASHQNDCLRGELGALYGDVDAHIDFAQEVLGGWWWW